MTLAAYLEALVQLRQRDPVLAEQWRQALVAELVARHQPSSLTERVLD